MLGNRQQEFGEGRIARCFGDGMHASSTAEYPFMPQSAIDNGVARLVLTPEEIRQFVVRLHRDPRFDAILPGDQEAKQ